MHTYILPLRSMAANSCLLLVALMLVALMLVAIILVAHMLVVLMLVVLMLFALISKVSLDVHLRILYNWYII